MMLGALFCAITLQTNSIWPAVFLHMIWNSGVMLMQFVSETLTPHPSTQIADYPAISFGSIIPLLIVFWIAVVILRLYSTRTGQSLRAVAPTYTVNDDISA
jgi:membrane protease YdiL (CAAX protease family)